MKYEIFRDQDSTCPFDLDDLSSPSVLDDVEDEESEETLEEREWLRRSASEEKTIRQRGRGKDEYSFTSQLPWFVQAHPRRMCLLYGRNQQLQ